MNAGVMDLWLQNYYPFEDKRWLCEIVTCR